MALLNVMKRACSGFVRSLIPHSAVLMFHHVIEAPAVEKSCCKLSFAHFQEIVIRYKAYFVPLKDVLRGVRKKAAITFDDGLADVYEKAYPFLKQENIPFTIFVITDFLDTPGYITTAQLKEMSKDPLVTIGSHGLSHDIFPTMKTEQKKKELVESKAVLESLTGREVDIFAYSHGQYDKETTKLAKCYRYAMSVRGTFLNCLTAKKYAMPRLNIDEKSYNAMLNRLDKQLCKIRK